MGAGRGGDGDRVDVVAGEQIVEVVDKDRLDSLRGCLPPCRIVVPHGDQLGVRVLAYPRGVLGCMHMPESKDRYRDRIGHGKSFLERSSGCGTVGGCSTVAVRHSVPDDPANPSAPRADIVQLQQGRMQ